MKIIGSFGMRGLTLLALVGATALAGCGGGKPAQEGKPAGGATPAAGKTTLVGLVLDKGGKNDKSFNTAAFEGAELAVKEGGIELKDVETMDDALFEPNLRGMAEKGCAIVIGIGFAQKEPLERVARAFPNTHFAIVDATVDLPNVASLLFDEHTGSYLVGAIAAASTQTGTIGFVGGMDIPLIRRFEMGYVAGAKQVNPKIQVLSNFVGVTSDAWNNPTRGKELATSQYQRGADIIFAPAGASNLGVFDAAEEMKKFVIGVDANQDWIKPGFVLTSMMKRVDTAVYQVIKEAAAGQFKPGVRSFGLANDGVGYSVDEHNQAILSPAARALADSLKAQIQAGTIQVPDYYEQQKH